MSNYTFATDAITTTIEAADDDDAAVRFAASEGFEGVTTMPGLLHRISLAGGHATVTDGRGDVVGRYDPNTGVVTYYPTGR